VDQFQEFIPFFLEEIDRDIIELQVIGGFAIGFFGFPDHIVISSAYGLLFYILIIWNFGPEGMRLPMQTGFIYPFRDLQGLMSLYPVVSSF